MENEKVKVFVYGTLKKGFKFFSRYNLDKFIISNKPATVKGFALHSLGPFPAAVEGRGKIKGEAGLFVLRRKFSCLSVLSDISPWI